METISREGIRYVGILATDVKDKLFLVGKIRQFAPDMVPFTFENSLVFAHPEYAETMDGVLVISSSPLFTEGAGWLPLSSAHSGLQRRQFTAEFQEGIFEAVRYLLESKVLPKVLPKSRSQPQVWISAVGNGSLGPIARLPVSAKGSAGRRFRYCASSQAGYDRSPLDNLAWKANLQVLLMSGVLCLLSLGLQKVDLLKEAGESGTVLRPLHGPLLISGSFLLAICAGVLVVVGTLPVWAQLVSPDWPVPVWNRWLALFLVVGDGVFFPRAPGGTCRDGPYELSGKRRFAARRCVCPPGVDVGGIPALDAWR